MKKTVPSATLIMVLSLLVVIIQICPAYSLNSREFTYGDTSVYGIDGYAPNLTISLDPPVFTASSTSISFTLKILEPFSARGTVVNQSDYYVCRKSLDFYLISGILLDCDRPKLIDTLWLNWGNSLNETHVQMERALYSQTYWVNFTKSGNTYFGSATLPELSEEVHNVTIWVRAEQDQVTTYVPFWLAVSNMKPLSSSPPTQNPLLTAKPSLFTYGPTPILSSAPSISPTEQPTIIPNSIVDGLAAYLLFFIIGIFVVTIPVAACAVIYLKKRKK